MDHGLTLIVDSTVQSKVHTTGFILTFYYNLSTLILQQGLHY